MANITEKELLELKKKSDKAKDEKSQLKGQLRSLYKQLEKKYNCTSLEEAEQEIQRIEKEKEKYRRAKQQGIETLKTEYSVLWD